MKYTTFAALWLNRSKPQQDIRSKFLIKQKKHWLNNKEQLKDKGKNRSQGKVLLWNNGDQIN